jgi:hypothetical protein
MQVTAKFSVDFPELNWGINAGEMRELPEDKEAASVILAHPDIVEVKLKKEGKKHD